MTKTKTTMFAPNGLGTATGKPTDAIPAGTFCGGDTIPAGTFHGQDSIPAGTFH